MFTKAIDFFIPLQNQDDQESFRKSRLAVGTFIIVGLFTFSYAVISLIIGFDGGFYSQALQALISAVCLFMFRRGVNENRVAFIFFTSAILTISAAVYYTGGFNSFIIPWLATTPIVALLVSGKKMGIYTLFAQLTMLSLFYVLTVIGVSPPESALAEPPLGFMLSTYWGLILIFYLIAVVFELGRMNAMALLSRKNQELQKVITKLHSTQDQLVQQEKLASLGQLTAGIAHEIKNPLNFVNNFSDLSSELIQEAREEIKSAGENRGTIAENSEAHLMNVLDILDDIDKNLKKIYEHGSRADGIVKSMLLHSRGGSGKKEPADLNKIIHEYVNLAFHGMRAGKAPINVDIQLDLDQSIGVIPLVTEDFSRVILNLCNNAFDAMREKLNFNDQVSKSKGYNPALSVQTKSKNGEIVIVIEDNGPGIPKDIQDKILQPFFTTKKGTDGTGLGLSITHDIVKAHGGELRLNSSEKGTVFTITLFEIT